MMRENTMLTKEIKGLRRRIQTLRIDTQSQGETDDGEANKAKTAVERSGLGRTMARYGVFGEGLPSDKVGGRDSSKSSRGKNVVSRQTATGANRKLTTNTGAAKDIEKQQQTMASLFKRLYELRELVMAEPGLGKDTLKSPYINEEELQKYREQLASKAMDTTANNDETTLDSTKNSETKESLPPINKNQGPAQLRG